MNKKYYYFIIYITIILIIVYNEFTCNKRNMFLKTQKDILHIDKNIIDIFKNNEILSNANIYWGIKTIKSIKKDKNTNKKDFTFIDVTQNKKNLICIEKNCFKFLGIIKKNNTFQVSLYCDFERKDKIKVLSTHERVFKSIGIEKISNDEVIFVDNKKNNRKWFFKLFDINLTKYKPKNIE